MGNTFPFSVLIHSLFCFCCQRFSFMPGQMTTELRCRAMLSLQQLYTPENLVFFVRGVRVEARGKSRYKLISLTFQETLLSSPLPLPPSPPLSAPHPHLPQAFSPLTPGHEWTRLAQRGVRNSTRATTHGSDNDTTRTLCRVSTVVR